MKSIVLFLLLVIGSTVVAQPIVMQSKAVLSPGVSINSLTWKNSEVVFASNPSAISRSTDNGESWEQYCLSTALGSPIVFAQYVSGDTLLVSGEHGVLRLLLPNQTMIPTSLPQASYITNVKAMKDPVTGDLIIARSNGTATIFNRSIDRGLTWPFLAAFSGCIDDFTIRADGKIFARVGNSIYSLNETTWTQVVTSSHPLTGSMVIDEAGSIYCATTDGGLLLSHSGLAESFYYIPAISNGQLNALAAGPYNTMFAAHSTGGFLHSLDRGFTWNPLQSDTAWVGNVMQVSPGGYVFAGTQEGRVCRSHQPVHPFNYGLLWHQLSDSLYSVGSDKVWAMLPDDLGSIYVGTWGGKVFHTTNAGESWINITENLRVGFVWSLVRDNDYLYAATEFGVFRSPVNAIYWTQTTLGYDVRSIVRVNGNLFAAAYGLGVYRSTDQGANWSMMNAGLTSVITTSLAVDSFQNLYVGSFGGGVQKSTNGGVSWSPTNLSYPYVWSLAVDANNIVYAGTYGSSVFRSTDLGATYEYASNGIWDPYIIQLTAIGTQVVAGSWWSGVFNTYNGGLNWNWISAPVSDIAATRSGKELNPGFFGEFSAKSPNVGNSVRVVIPSEYKLEQNFPNPFNPSTSIRFALPEATSVKLTVFDSQGRTVASLVSGEVNAGNHTVEFNGDHLPSGMYFYRLQADHFQATGKMILSK